jgi:hypothetical protein
LYGIDSFDKIVVEQRLIQAINPPGGYIFNAARRISMVQLRFGGCRNWSGNGAGVSAPASPDTVWNYAMSARYTWNAK